VILDIGGKTASKPEDVLQALASLRKDGKHTVLMRLKSADGTKPPLRVGRRFGTFAHLKT
jgi:hypothetical protein